MNTKTLFAVSASAVLFLAAGQCLAVVYSPANYGQAQSGTMQPSGQIMQTTPMMLNSNGQNMGYSSMPVQPYGNFMAYGYARGAAIWFGLMSVITVTLVWIVLIQLIFVLRHWLKKHKH